jgi:hypothetical protein
MNLDNGDLGSAIPNGDSPPDHTIVQPVKNGPSVAIPNSTVNAESSNIGNVLGSSASSITQDPNQFATSIAKAGLLRSAVGLSNTQSQNSVPVGVDTSGNKLYSNPQLANSNDLNSGKNIIQQSGMALGAMGAFADHSEASTFLQIGEKATDPNFLGALDNFKNTQDAKGFVSHLSSAGGSTDLAHNGYSACKMFDNWGSMSPAQKSIAVAGVGTQGFKFSDGQTFDTKSVTPTIPNVPDMSASQALTLAGQGVNVAPATRNWGQHAVVQQTMFKPTSSFDVVNTSNSLGLLGHGMDGQAVPVTAETLKANSMTPAPHYGVGAATIPLGQGLPQGYTKLMDSKGNQLIIPSSNASTSSMATPDISTQNAKLVYANWPKTDSQPTKGTLGGNAMIGGLMGMASSNPFSLGAVTTHATYEHTGTPSDVTDLAHVSSMAGITLSRLTGGGASPQIDSKQQVTPMTGELNQNAFGAGIKQIRGDFAQNGIPSKEVGYQLANQAYAEGRLNESQHVAALQNLNTVFDDNGFMQAQKLNTGISKGLAILGATAAGMMGV